MGMLGVLPYLDNVKLENIPSVDLDKILEDLRNVKKESDYHIKRIIGRKFKDTYLGKAKDTFIPLEDLLRKIDNENWLEPKGRELYKELETLVYSKDNKYPLSEILSECKSLGLKIPKDVAKMVCMCCVCGGCPSQEECHWTCKECKSEGYTKYSWECEE